MAGYLLLRPSGVFSTAGPGKCLPRQSDFGRSFWTLLAACSRDPSLAKGAGGGAGGVAVSSGWFVFVCFPPSLQKDCSGLVHNSRWLQFGSAEPQRFCSGSLEEDFFVFPRWGKWLIRGEG